MTTGLAQHRALEPRDPALARGRERAEAQRWALELSQIADPEARQAALTSAPAHWQPVIRHYLVWRLGMSALRATLRRTEPPTSGKPAAAEAG